MCFIQNNLNLNFIFYIRYLYLSFLTYFTALYSLVAHDQASYIIIAKIKIQIYHGG